MFSYQHRYHAGGLADVHKHLCLIALLTSFHKKPTSFGVLDAYAGEGIYDLYCPEAQKIKEYETGIGLLYSQKTSSHSPLVQRYLEEIRKINTSDNIRYYPGSSALIRSFLREHDHAYLVEKHPQAIQALRSHFKNDPRIHIHHRAAEEAMVALVPFKEKRGLIFIDPSYEVKKDYHTLPKIIQQVHKRFSNAVIALWYPLLPNRAHLTLVNNLQSYSFPSSRIHEWLPSHPSSLKDSTEHGLLGSGLFFINTPWRLSLPAIFEPIKV